MGKEYLKNNKESEQTPTFVRHEPKAFKQIKKPRSRNRHRDDQERELQSDEATTGKRSDLIRQESSCRDLDLEFLVSFSQYDSEPELFAGKNSTIIKDIMSLNLTKEELGLLLAEKRLSLPPPKITREMQLLIDLKATLTEPKTKITNTIPIYNWILQRGVYFHLTKDILYRSIFTMHQLIEQQQAGRHRFLNIHNLELFAFVCIFISWKLDTNTYKPVNEMEKCIKQSEFWFSYSHLLQAESLVLKVMYVGIKKLNYRLPSLPSVHCSIISAVKKWENYIKNLSDKKTFELPSFNAFKLIEEATSLPLERNDQSKKLKNLLKLIHFVDCIVIQEVDTYLSYDSLEQESRNYELAVYKAIYHLIIVDRTIPIRKVSFMFSAFLKQHNLQMKILKNNRLLQAIDKFISNKESETRMEQISTSIIRNMSHYFNCNKIQEICSECQIIINIELIIGRQIHLSLLEL